jgi:hypothetical protein
MYISRNYLFKVIALTIIVLLLDIVIRYVLMQAHLLSIRPFSAATGGENHFYNIAKAFIWNIVMVGWCYFIYVMTMSFICHRFPTSFLWVFIRSLVVYIALSTIYVLISDVNREEFITENIVASIPLSYLFSVLYSYWFFERARKTKDSNG